MFDSWIVWAAAVGHDHHRQMDTLEEKQKQTPYLPLFQSSNVNIICAIGYYSKRSLLSAVSKWS